MNRRARAKFILHMQHEFGRCDSWRPVARADGRLIVRLIVRDFTQMVCLDVDSR